jgi:hypothetical protein
MELFKEPVKVDALPGENRLNEYIVTSNVKFE